jgi:putative phosphoribosyl transferase
MHGRPTIFDDRRDAAQHLGSALSDLLPADPVVVGIPRGGVVTAAEIAARLGAPLDVVLARKLRSPEHPELAIGAMTEDGRVLLNPHSAWRPEEESSFEREVAHQRDEIARRRALYRAVRPHEPLRGRTVIIADDGLATGATALAAIESVRTEGAKKVIVAAPVASPEAMEVVRSAADATIVPLVPENFIAVGQFYREFETTTDDDVIALLAAHLAARAR